ncbi:serine hydrolase domain-containing protein [Acinetobacter sichuanensis]|uniref:Class A beta-lactamase-related serine hydrolase n=1 Tax=Acinetobacter sichuanensis TaxID=2136183 RepID=A0A371YL72_9GAMM|nr:serine hydrolase domain-containing protein [Acinetobacter sichuanensis]RFC82200.1 class A beta-lactamase-related serine hydrolase [Acinetobacter sichuanensis]
MINNVKGLDVTALTRLQEVIQKDIDDNVYDGANIIVARHGEIGLSAALGWADKSAQRDTKIDDLYTIFSMTKAFTNFLILRAIDQGLLSFTTKVIDIIPEFLGRDRFRGAKKDRINIGHLLTHRAGLITTPTPVSYDDLGNLDKVIDAICQLDVVGEPGVTQNYSPALNHALLGEIAKRVFQYKTVNELLKTELFDPLEMNSTRLGAPSEWKSKYVPVKAKFPDGQWLSVHDIEVMNEIMKDDTEMPWVGAVSSVEDIFKFTEMLRNGGTYNGKRLLSPAIINFATQNHTGSTPSDLYVYLAQSRGWDIPPSNIGLGFALAGAGLTPSYFGPLTSPKTFGNYGAGSTLFWVDPETDLSFVFLSSGVIDECDNILRFEKLSTLAAACVI